MPKLSTEKAFILTLSLSPPPTTSRKLEPSEVLSSLNPLSLYRPAKILSSNNSTVVKVDNPLPPKITLRLVLSPIELSLPPKIPLRFPETVLLFPPKIPDKIPETVLIAPPTIPD